MLRGDSLGHLDCIAWFADNVFDPWCFFLSPFLSGSYQFTLVDNNATHDDDALYGSETLSLDALTHTTMTRLRSEEKLVDPLDYTVTFDEPMGQGM